MVCRFRMLYSSLLQGIVYAESSRKSNFDRNFQGIVFPNLVTGT